MTIRREDDDVQHLYISACRDMACCIALEFRTRRMAFLWDNVSDIVALVCYLGRAVLHVGPRKSQLSNCQSLK